MITLLVIFYGVFFFTRIVLLEWLLTPKIFKLKINHAPCTNQSTNRIRRIHWMKDIKWYELQVELTDHMITSMEEFWAKDPD
jgi:hypothetical protein